MSAIASGIASPPRLFGCKFPEWTAEDNGEMLIPFNISGSIRSTPSRLQFKPIGVKRPITCPIHAKRASPICALTMNARCAAEQAQTVTRQSSAITVAPTQGKEKSPKLDDGGAGFPPRDDGGGGGGGGGGWNWSGGFYLFGFLAFLSFLKDKESEGAYNQDERR